MTGAPQNRGAPLLLLLLLLPGCRCRCLGAECWVPPSRVPVTPVTVESAWSADCAHGGVEVDPGPTSRAGTVGDSLSLECRFRAPRDARAAWFRVCPGANCSRPRAPVEPDGAGRLVRHEDGRLVLTFQRLEHGDSGLYYCRVEAARGANQSCGTFLRVRDPDLVPFLNLNEATKNRIITAEGVLLLLFAAGPSLFLLFRKRWENERLLQTKKNALEEENLYEGLNLDECSMYEDISRGLQPTYQDVGSFQDADSHLEKP